MSAQPKCIVIGQDGYPLPDIHNLLSVEMRTLWDRYSEAFHSGDEDAADVWAAVVADIAAFMPLATADLAAKLFLGLHYLHPADNDVAGAMAIETSSLEIDGAGEILISSAQGCLSHPLIVSEMTA